MTGFARREGARGAWSFTVEARSVNGRGLEARTRLPPGFDGLERIAREAAAARFQRGQLNITVQARRAGLTGEVHVNSAVLEVYLAAAAPLIASARALTPAVDGLLALPGVVDAGEAVDDASERTALETSIAVTVNDALDDLSRARLEEGAVLSGLIDGFLDRIAALVADSEAAALAQPALIRERFRRRLEELAGEAATPERILQEAAVQATRADVREELDRLAAHVAAARALIGSAGPCGRRLDFLAQEFMREANTLTAKAATPELTAAGLELKAVIDQLREQVQNVE
jgi:uncharacterized protein (TIGR00255 family)